MLAGCSAARAFLASATNRLATSAACAACGDSAWTGSGGFADLLRVGLRQPLLEAPSAEQHDEPVLSHRPHDQLHTGNPDLLQQAAQPRAGLGRDPPGAPVRDADPERPPSRSCRAPRGPVSVSCRSIPTASRTPRPMRNWSGSYPKRPRCPGPLPGVMPGATGSANPKRSLCGQGVQIGRLRRLQLRLAVERSAAARPRRPSPRERSSSAPAAPKPSSRRRPSSFCTAMFLPGTAGWRSARPSSPRRWRSQEVSDVPWSSRQGRVGARRLRGRGLLGSPPRGLPATSWTSPSRRATTS